MAFHILRKRGAGQMKGGRRILVQILKVGILCPGRNIDSGTLSVLVPGYGRASGIEIFFIGGQTLAVCGMD